MKAVMAANKVTNDITQQFQYVIKSAFGGQLIVYSIELL
jgi:hypothetical protein